MSGRINCIMYRYNVYIKDLGIYSNYNDKMAPYLAIGLGKLFRENMDCFDFGFVAIDYFCLRVVHTI